MAMPSTENSEQSIAFSEHADHSEDNNTVPSSIHHRHDWNKLKSMISFHLKQVLSDYPEAKMLTREEQNVSLGETYIDLVKRLDEALQRFHEGPPFTLQRLCEILLAARSIYPNLSKLALALEKNLLVTSTITIAMDPYPPQVTTQRPEETDKPGEIEHPEAMENGVEEAIMTGDRDEIMTEVEDDMTIDMVAFEEIVVSSDSNSTTATTTTIATSTPNS